MKPAGKVYLVGAGPGAPDLLTVRALRLLEQADIVLHDALVHPETVELATTAIKVAVGKRCGTRSAEQAFINRRLVHAACRHRTVVRLKGGDPMLFGRAQEEIDALEAAGIDFEVVPGITAALAAAAQTRMPLTQRGLSRSVAFATPSRGCDTPDADWVNAVRSSDAAAIYMGRRHAAEIARRLIAAGHARSTPILVCTDVSLPTAKSIAARLDELPRLATSIGDVPTLILLGNVFRKAVTATLGARPEVA